VHSLQLRKTSTHKIRVCKNLQLQKRLSAGPYCGNRGVRCELVVIKLTAINVHHALQKSAEEAPTKKRFDQKTITHLHSLYKAPQARAPAHLHDEEAGRVGNFRRQISTQIIVIQQSAKMHTCEISTSTGYVAGKRASPRNLQFRSLTCGPGLGDCRAPLECCRSRSCCSYACVIQQKINFVKLFLQKTQSKL
jgi:hypothetical protein